jgi:hypothetical protein
VEWLHGWGKGKAERENDRSNPSGVVGPKQFRCQNDSVSRTVSRSGEFASVFFEYRRKCPDARRGGRGTRERGWTTGFRLEVARICLIRDSTPFGMTRLSDAVASLNATLGASKSSETCHENLACPQYPPRSSSDRRSVRFRCASRPSVHLRQPALAAVSRGGGDGGFGRRPAANQVWSERRGGLERGGAVFALVAVHLGRPNLPDDLQ